MDAVGGELCGLRADFETLVPAGMFVSLELCLGALCYRLRVAQKGREKGFEKCPVETPSTHRV